MSGARDAAARTRSRAASAASHASWANTTDRAARQAPAWEGKFRTYLERVDPDCELDEAERERRAIALRKEDLDGMTAKAVKARRDLRVRFIEARDALLLRLADSPDGTVVVTIEDVRPLLGARLPKWFREEGA